MVDVSGEGWVKHALFGTSRLLQLRGPEAHLKGCGRSFFLTIRPFEICRSIFFTQAGKTFLVQENWVSLRSKMWEGDMMDDWHPKEELLDIMTSCSSLGNS